MARRARAENVFMVLERRRLICRRRGRQEGVVDHGRKGAMVGEGMAGDKARLTRPGGMPGQEGRKEGDTMVE